MSSRHIRRGLAAAVVLAASVQVLTACGTPQRLPAVNVGKVVADSPLKDIRLRRVDSFTTLDHVLAPQGRTALLVVDPGCDRCAILVPGLAEAAFANEFSALVLGAPTAPDQVASVADERGIGRWGIVAPDAAEIADALGVEALPALVVLSADGEVVASASGQSLELDTSATLQAAAQCPASEPCP